MQGSPYSIDRCRVEAVKGPWPNHAMRHHPLLSRSFGMKANDITIAEVDKDINSSLWLSVAMIKILLRDAVDNLRRDQDNIRDQDSIAKEMDPDRIVKEMSLEAEIGDGTLRQRQIIVQLNSDVEGASTTDRRFRIRRALLSKASTLLRKMMRTEERVTSRTYLLPVTRLRRTG